MPPSYRSSHVTSNLGWFLDSYSYYLYLTHFVDLILSISHFSCSQTNSVNSYIHEDVNILLKLHFLFRRFNISCIVNLVTMAPKRSTKRQKTTGNALDMGNYLNWPASILREKLKEAHINASLSFPLFVFRKLYADNIIEADTDANSSLLNQQSFSQDIENVPSNIGTSSGSEHSNNLPTSSNASSCTTSPSTIYLNKPDLNLPLSYNPWWIPFKVFKPWYQQRNPIQPRSTAFRITTNQQRRLPRLRPRGNSERTPRI